MKIWFQSSIDYANHPAYARTLAKYLSQVGSPGTTMTVHGMDERIGQGLPMLDICSSPVVWAATVDRMFIHAFTH